MTNEQIIFNERIKLMEDGKIGGTGHTIEIETEDGTITMEEPEQIHTFQIWKSLGYSVKKGEHAIAKFTIWKHVPGKVAELPDGSGEYMEKAKMFMKSASFFSPAQVEKITQ